MRCRSVLRSFAAFPDDGMHVVNGLRRQQLVRGVQVCRIGEDGRGIVHLFVRKTKQEFEFPFDRAIPGERLTLEVTSAKKDRYNKKDPGRYRLAIAERGAASPDEVSPQCEHFMEGCGGCTFQNLAYESQLREKHALQLRLQELYGLEATLEAPVPSPSPYGFHSRMTFRFFNRGGLQLGLNPAKSPVPVATARCRLQTAASQRAFEAALSAARRDPACRAFDPRTGQGWLVSAMLTTTRAPAGEHEVLVTLAANRAVDRAAAGRLAEALVSGCQEIVGVTLSIVGGEGKGDEHDTGWRHTGRQRHELLAGRAHALQDLCSLSMQVAGEGFVRPNLLLAEELHRTALDFADVRPNQVVWDAFCGQGALSLLLAQRCRHLVAMDRSQPALASLLGNLRLHKLAGKATFWCLDLGSPASLRELAARVHDEGLAAWPGGPEDAWPADGAASGAVSSQGAGSAPPADPGDRDWLETPRILSRPDVLLMDPGRNGLPKAFRRLLYSLQVPKLVYISSGKPLFRDCVLLERRGYEVVALKSFDFYPHTARLETVAELRWRGY